MRHPLLYILLTFSLLFVNVTESKALFTKVHTPEYYESNARELFRQNKWAEGKAMLDEGWEDFGSMSVMNELMGRYYTHYRKYDKARYFLVRAINDDRSNTLARELLVKVEEETRNYSSAICYINELLEDNPYDRELWRKKIGIYRKQGNTNEADRLLSRLQQIYPEDETVKKDVVYENELRLARQKRSGDVLAQIETLQTLVRTRPTKAEYYSQLAGALSQAGRKTEAVEVLGQGATITHSTELMKRRAALLAEQGRYTEAMNYLRDCMKRHPSTDLKTALNDTELLAAESAQMNDPYTAMAKVYASQHNDEALNYLLNTSIARGYYEDALMYIKEAKQRRGETEDLLYKEFVVNRRLGNKNKALACLTKIHAINPRNTEVNDYLCEMRYAEAADNMGYGQFSEAIPLLEYVQENATEEDIKRAAMRRLFNCYYETRRFDQAHQQLEALRKAYDYDNYAYQKAALLHREGRTDKALRLLASESEKTQDAYQSSLLAFQYEEYALPYIKDMMRKGMIRQADAWAKEALAVCPTSADIIRYAITTSDILGHSTDYEDMIIAARARFPEDPFFIVKESDVLARNKDYAGAVNLLRPELNTFSGDSAIVYSFADASRLLANDQAKARAYASAIATIDTALVYCHGNRELLTAKGEIYERMGQYDSAYVYQRYYRPSLMDYRQHSRHMEELKHGTFRNDFSIAYQGGYQSLASIAYTHKSKGKSNKGGNNSKPDKGTINTLSFFADYTTAAPVPGASAAGSTAAPVPGASASGSTTSSAIRLGAAWQHRSTSPYAYGISAAWASDAFAQAAAAAFVERTMGHSYTLNLHGTYRHLKASTVSQLSTSNATEGVSKNIASAGISLTRSNELFSVAATADAIIANDKAYIEGTIAGRFYPIERSATHLFATISAGNALQQHLLDAAIYGHYGHLSTGLSAGIHWVFSRHVAAALSGAWYNQSIHAQTKDLFLIQGRLHLTF